MGDQTHMRTKFAERLKELRSEKGLSQVQLAKRAKMNVGGIAKLEQGVREPSLATAFRIADALGVSVEQFRSKTPNHSTGKHTTPTKLVLSGEGRMDEATALTRCVQESRTDRTSWGVLADWLADHKSDAEVHCRRRIALLEHGARDPRELKQRHKTRERRREARQEARRVWEAEGRLIERDYGPEIRGGFARLHSDSLWILWADPFTQRDVRADLFLHHCRQSHNPRALIGLLLSVLPQLGTGHYVQARELCLAYVEGKPIPKTLSAELQPERLTGDGDERSRPGRIGGFRTICSMAVLSRLVKAIYTQNPFAELVGDSERIDMDWYGLRDEVPGDALEIQKNPFAPPGTT